MTGSSKAWIIFAEKDLLAAVELFKNKDLYNIVLFHCQQCIEKCFKAVLDNNGIEIPRVHSVVKLHNDLKIKLKINDLANSEDLEMIDDIYTDTRYPGSFGILPSGFPEVKEAEKVLNITKEIYKLTLELLKV